MNPEEWQRISRERQLIEMKELQRMRDVRKIAMIMKKEQQAERKRRESTAVFTESP